MLISESTTPQEFFLQCDIRGLKWFSLGNCYDCRGYTIPSHPDYYITSREVCPLQAEVESIGRIWDLEDRMSCGLGIHLHYCMIDISKFQNFPDIGTYKIQKTARGSFAFYKRSTVYSYSSWIEITPINDTMIGSLKDAAFKIKNGKLIEPVIKDFEEMLNESRGILD